MLHDLHKPLIARAFSQALAAASARLGTRGPAPFAEYVNDPVGWARDVRGIEPWVSPVNEEIGQVQILEALRDKRRVLVAGCNGCGKSVLIGDMAIPWFMTSRGDARVRLTSGSAPQVMNVHNKLRNAHATSLRPLPGEVLKTPKWELGPSWLYDGLSPDTEETMQGLHSSGLIDEPGEDGGLLAIIDEASAAQDFKYKAMRGYLTTDNTYFMGLGNPNKPDGWFKEAWDAAANDPDWARFQISAFDVPDTIISPKWIESETRYWGVDSPQYQVRVLGQFPSVGGDYMVFPLSDFEGTKDIFPMDGSGLHLGVDIARGDADQNVMVLVEDGRVTETMGWHSRDLMLTAVKVAEWIEKFGVPPRNVHIDVIGLGAGVVDRLREVGYQVEGVNFGAKAQGDSKKIIGKNVRVKNRRAELFWVARCQLRAGRASVPAEFRRQIWAEASRIQYLPQDVIQIEAKEKIKKKLDGKSPDYTDAWVLSFSRSGQRMPAYFL
jgi:hypothetical protein